MPVLKKSCLYGLFMASMLMGVSNPAFSACVGPDIYGDIVCSGTSTDTATGGLGYNWIYVEVGAQVSAVYGSLSAADDAAGGDDDIEISEHSTVTGDVFGDYLTGDNATGGDDTISVYPLATVSGNLYGDNIEGLNPIGGDDTIYVLGGTVSGSLLGDYLITDPSNQNSSAVGGTDTIYISSNSTVNLVAGDYIVGSNSMGGNDEITIENSMVSLSITGDTFENGSDHVGGDDTIIVSDSSTIGVRVSGDYFADGDNNTGGDDVIRITGSSTVGENIYGDYFGDGTNMTGGDDIITISNAAVSGSIYGEYFAAGDTEDNIFSGDDTINLTRAAVGGSVYGMNGSDTVNYYGNGNSVGGVIDGGDDVSKADGFIDVLNIIDYSGDAFDNYLNFEEVNLIRTTLDFGNSFTAPQSITYTIDEDSTLILTGGGSGDYTINASVINNGTMDFADGGISDHLTVTGDFVSNDATYLIDIDFKSKQADYLTVDGEFSGSGTVQVNPLYLASTTASSSTEIVLVDAPNDTNSDDTDFVYAQHDRYNNNSKLGRFSQSPFVWQLKNDDGDLVIGHVESNSSSSTSDESTATPTVISELPAYVSLPTFSREVVMNELDTLHQRLGELRDNRGWVATDASSEHPSMHYNNAIDFDESKLNGWVRGTLAHFSFDKGNSFDVDGDYQSLDLGFDKRFNPTDYSTVFLGAFYGASHGDFNNNGEGEIYPSLTPANTDIDSWSLGLYATLFNYSGTYVDLVGEYMDMDADIDAVDLFSTDGHMIGGSIEVGQSIDLKERWIVEPQGQIKVAYVDWDGFHDGYNNVDFHDHTYVTGRLGLRTEYTIDMGSNTGAAVESAQSATIEGNNLEPAPADKETKLWLYGGVLHEFTDAPKVIYVIDFDSHQYDTIGQVMGGVTFDLSQKMQFYGDISYSSDFGDYHAVRGDVGLRVRW